VSAAAVTVEKGAAQSLGTLKTQFCGSDITILS
jgi:hypothetical protein